MAGCCLSGMYGQSTMRKVDLQTGNVLLKTDMAQQWFGEGATRLGNYLYQITWQTSQGFIYQLPDLKQVPANAHSAARSQHCYMQQPPGQLELQ